MPVTTDKPGVSAPSPERDAAQDAGELNARLLGELRRYGDLAIAVSGGIDSMTLAFVAHRFLDRPPTMVHAVSPAVPAEATLRIRDYARREGWRLSLVDAGEFGDPSYRANPVNRCYFCKSNLYDRIRGLAFGAIASGTNLDDLGDVRPGLKAAAERRVIHPFVEAGIGKSGIRLLARLHGLLDLADLPAQPCLASRVETGIRIEAGDLAFIDAVERQIRELAPPQADVRCRLTRGGVVLEIGGQGDADRNVFAQRAASICRDAGRVFVGVRPYRQGSAFIDTSDRAHVHGN
ncbi:MAG TPA: adenine nucleotide alpha hydrolase [Pseudorhodoplanes sp.]|jgi:uncharacterized protein|nr:adenine nucleotide alpha hydrolase [Pseudorhodoplanes sp.]